MKNNYTNYELMVEAQTKRFGTFSLLLHFLTAKKKEEIPLTRRSKILDWIISISKAAKLKGC